MPNDGNDEWSAIARQTSDREDLIREATALVQRCRILVHEEPIVVGFRRNGAASFFFDVDPVYQFNDRRELRRAYQDGRLIKAESGTLVALTRQETPTQIQLVRHPLSAEQRVEFLNEAERRLGWLAQVLREGKYAIDSAVVSDSDVDEDVLGKVRYWLEQLGWPLVVARTARL